MKTIELINHINKIKAEAPSNDSRRFVVSAYSRVIKKLLSLNLDSVTAHDIDQLELTKYMKSKIRELIRLPALKSQIYTQLEEIPGIGPTKIRELVILGLRDIKHLKQKKYFDGLSRSAKLFVEKNPERKIPHHVIAAIEALLSQAGSNSKKWDTTFVGSYRRASPMSRDIDIMLVSANPADLENYIEFVKTRMSDLYQYSAGPDKASFLLGINTKYYKFDVFRTPPSKKWPMLLYSTGSKEFNIWMRGLAKSKGYLLNQEGIFKIDKPGKPFLVKSEKGYFDILDIKYAAPADRKPFKSG